MHECLYHSLDTQKKVREMNQELYNLNSVFQNQVPGILNVFFLFLQEHYNQAQHILRINCSEVLAEFSEGQTCHCSYDMHVVTFYLDCLTLQDKGTIVLSKYWESLDPTSYSKISEFCRVDNGTVDRQNVMTVLDIQLYMTLYAGTAIGTVNTA